MPRYRKFRIIGYIVAFVSCMIINRLANSIFLGLTVYLIEIITVDLINPKT